MGLRQFVADRPKLAIQGEGTLGSGSEQRKPIGGPRITALVRDGWGTNEISFGSECALLRAHENQFLLAHVTAGGNRAWARRNGCGALLEIHPLLLMVLSTP